jgi:hypothetical protein
MGPSAALKGPGFKRGSRGNAIANGMTNFTPRAIAYTVVQVGFEHPDNLLVLTQHLLGSLRPLVHARMGLNGRRL